MSIRRQVRKALWRMGYEFARVTPESHPLARRRSLLESYGIDLVLDVGANTGRWGKQMRNEIGYAGAIISFEPLRSEFEKLRARADGDAKWTAMNCALGEADGEADINIAGDSYSSSLLGMLESHVESAPESGYVGRETIRIRTLDDVMGDLSFDEKNIYLKMDTQGYESRVLGGAEQSLGRIDTVQMEMSLTPRYQGELLFPELSALMGSKGYVLVAIEPGFTDRRTGQLLQIDGIFHRFAS